MYAKIVKCPGCGNEGSNYGVNLTEKGFLRLKGLGNIAVGE
jgi:hypothetical protein